MRYQHFVLSFLLLGMTGAVHAQTGSPLTKEQQQTTTEGLQIAKKDPFGAYLTDTEGHAVYIFSKDKDGKSLCNGPCMEGWPPVRSKGRPNAGDGIDQSKIGVIDKEGGASQITYDKHPLYYYKQDKGTQATSGQDAYSYDGDWNLIAPNGEPIKSKRPGEIPQER